MDIDHTEQKKPHTEKSYTQKNHTHRKKYTHLHIHTNTHKKSAHTHIKKEHILREARDRVGIFYTVVKCKNT